VRGGNLRVWDMQHSGDILQPQLCQFLVSADALRQSFIAYLRSQKEFKKPDFDITIILSPRIPSSDPDVIHFKSSMGTLFLTYSTAKRCSNFLDQIFAHMLRSSKARPSAQVHGVLGDIDESDHLYFKDFVRARRYGSDKVCEHMRCSLGDVHGQPLEYRYFLDQYKLRPGIWEQAEDGTLVIYFTSRFFLHNFYERFIAQLRTALSYPVLHGYVEEFIYKGRPGAHRRAEEYIDIVGRRHPDVVPVWRDVNDFLRGEIAEYYRTHILFSTPRTVKSMLTIPVPLTTPPLVKVNPLQPRRLEQDATGESTLYGRAYLIFDFFRKRIPSFWR